MAGEGIRNYRRGVEKERDAVKELYEMGALQVMRSAGSKGPWDIFAVFKTCVIALQIKRIKNSRCNLLSMYKENLKFLESIPVPPWIRQALWCWVDRKGWEKIEIGRS